MFKSYVVNLDRDVERLAAFQASADANGLAVERVSGVLGADLGSAPDVNSFFMEDGVVPPKVYAALKPGEIGNYASFLRVMKKVIADGVSSALVFEDDCLVTPQLATVARDAITKAPADWDFIRLSNEPKRAYVVVAKLAGGYELVRYSKIPNSAMAFLVTARGARKFLKPGLRTLASDEDLRRPWRFGLVQYGVVPMAIGLQPVTSTIDALGARQARHAVLRRLKSPTDTRAETIARLTYNIQALGAKDWALCAGLNLQRMVGRRLLRKMRSEAAPRLCHLEI